MPVGLLFLSAIFTFIQISISNGKDFNQNDTDFVNILFGNLSLALSKHSEELLHFTNMQSLYHKYPPTVLQPLHTDVILDKIVLNVRDRLVKGTEILQRNKDFIETSYKLKLENEQKVEVCCAEKTSQINGTTTVFKESRASTCYLNPLRGKLVPYLTATKLFQDNTEQDIYNIFVQQYFGDSDGSYLQYPSPLDGSCTDTRKSHIFSNWYVFTASPKKKNIIILIDASGSMAWNIGGPRHPKTPHRLDVAKEAALTVLDTLSPTDHVGVLSFGDHTRSPPSCLGTHMGKASGYNKALLKDFITKIVVQNNTYFKEAFTEAFKLLSATKQKIPSQFEDSEDIILLLTDGIPTENPPHKKLLHAIVDGQSEMKNSVHVFLYALGWEMFNGENANINIQTLMKLADQNNKLLTPPDSSPDVLQWPDFPDTPVGPPGYITFIPDANGQHLSTILGRYYTHLPMVTRTTPTISLPYLKQELGHVVTLGLPVSDDGGEFVGVVALDLSLEALLYDVHQYNAGHHNSFVFVSGIGGILVSHPFLRRPHNRGDSRLFHIQDLEPTLTEEALYNITNGIKGWQTTRGVDSKNCLATFYYTPVNGFEDSFVAVLKKCEKEDMETYQNTSTLGLNEKVTLQNTVYEKMKTSDTNVCILEGIPVLNNETVTWFPSDVVAGHIHSFGPIQNISQIDEGLFDNITDFALQFGVSIGTAIDLYLTKQQTDSSDVLWRYVGTANGVFQVFPGTVLSDMYDPRLDTWYKEATKNTHATVFLAQNDSIVTLSRALFKDRERVAGVLAADVDTRQMNAVFLNILQPCNKENKQCFILNDKGYIMYEETLQQTHQHITQVLPEVASSLLRIGLLEADWCEDLESSHFVLAHQLKHQAYTSTTANNCQKYWIRPVYETNLFLLVTMSSSKCTQSQSKTCSCTTQCSPCTALGKTNECQCPCTCKSRPQDTCNTNISTGHQVCPGRGRHWKTLTKKIIVKPEELNLTVCEPSCNSLLDATNCSLVPGCQWCTSGLYKSAPLCTKHCIIDRLDIQYRYPCMNISSLGARITDELLQNVSLSFDTLLSQFQNVASSSPTIDQGIITITVYTLDGESVEQNVQNVINTSPILVICRVCHTTTLTLYPKALPFTKLGITLHLNEVNFTSQLTTALTLRAFVERTLRDFIATNLQPPVANSLANIWLFDDKVSFTLTVPQGFTSDQLEDAVGSLTNEMLINHTTFALMDTITSLKAVTMTTGDNDVCGRPCNYTLNRADCNIRDECRWEIYHGNDDSGCSEDAYLPERFEAVVYFPCLGLYNKLSMTEQTQVVTEVKLKVKTALTHFSDKATIGFSYGQDNLTIGTMVTFTLRGTIRDPLISNSLQHLTHVLESLTVNVGMQTYIGYSKPRQKRHFTNLQVVLTVSMMDFDQLLKTSPLTAREDVVRAVQSLVDRYFIPSIAQTLTDVQPYQMYLPFMVWQSADSDLDLGLYYDQLRRDVDAGRVWITLGGTRYTVDNLYYQGSFYQICPRSCHQNLSQSVCNWLPNCGWSHKLAQCTTDALLPERHEMTVLVPCNVLPDRTSLETDALIASFQHEVEHVLLVYPNISSRNVHSFGIGQVYPSSLAFTVQRSMMSPPLSRMVEDLNKWIAEGGLMIDTGPNSTRITATALGNFTELEVELRYDAMNFTNTTDLTNRKLVAENLTRLIEDVFPLGVIYVANFRLSQKYIRFDAEKTGDMSLREMEKRMHELWRLGGFGIVQGNVKHLPNEIKFQEKFHSNCTLDCSTSLDAGHCNKLQKCVWFTEGNVSHCVRDHKLPDRFQLDLFVPCMDLNSFSATEINTMEQMLLHNFTTMLGTPNSNVVTNVTFTQTDVRVDLQASVQFPNLGRYVSVISNHTDYRTGFRFGVPPSISFRNRLDYTNVHVRLVFYSIDFELLKIKYSYNDLTAKVVRSLNNILLGVLVKSLEMISIYRETVEFTVSKDRDSKVHMEDEMKILTTIVEEGQFSLDIPFVRPVVASSIVVTGSFRQLCPDQYPALTTPIIDVPVTVSVANMTTLQPITTTLPWSRPSVILIYNRSEIQQSLLQSQMESFGLSSCLVDIRQCPVCMTRFSRNTCSFDDSVVASLPTHTPIDTTPDQPSKLPLPDDSFHIGPVAATTMAVGGFFVLALLMWAAQSIHEAMKKKNGHKPETENDPTSQAGRGIEELPEAD